VSKLIVAGDDAVILVDDLEEFVLVQLLVNFRHVTGDPMFGEHVVEVVKGVPDQRTGYEDTVVAHSYTSSNKGSVPYSRSWRNSANSKSIISSMSIASRRSISKIAGSSPMRFFRRSIES